MIKKIRSRLSVKVFLLTLALTIMCCFITCSFLFWAIPNFYKYDLADAEIELPFIADAMLAEDKENGYYIPMCIDEDMQIRYKAEFALHFFKSDGQEVSLYDMDVLTGGHITDFDNIEKSKAYAITFSDSDSSYILLLARNTAKKTQIEEAVQRTLLPLCIVIFACSIISSFFYSWYMTAPIQSVSKLSKQMADMDFGGFCSVGRSDEIGILSDSLNTLSRKLESTLSELQEANQKLQADIDKERQLEKQRVEFFSAASHELKTPITIIKGQLQGMLYRVGRYKDRETYLAQSLEVTDTLEKMVQELLTISRLDAPGYACKKARLNLSGLMNDRLTAFEDLFIQKELAVEKSISPEVSVSGDVQLLQKVLDNLLGNAAAYSPAGNRIFVKLWQNDHKAKLTIENTGAHIPPGEAVSKLFEPFYRVDPSRNRQTGGTGLGLHIVKTVLDLHGATIEIANTDQGVIASLAFSIST